LAAKIGARRKSSLKLVLPLSMMVSPGLSNGTRFSIICSVVLPDGNIIQMARGAGSGGDQRRQIVGTYGAVFLELADGVVATIVDDDAVPMASPALGHAGAHAS
jgi:hypothetical protein